jgi:hypothetical protein
MHWPPQFIGGPELHKRRYDLGGDNQDLPRIFRNNGGHTDPVLEIAYTPANATAVLDSTKATGRVSDTDFRRVGWISFFCEQESD